MRILYFNQHFSTQNGKTGTRSYRMAKALIDQGHSVTMVCGSYAAGSTDLSGEFTQGRRFGKIDCIDVIEFDLVHDNKDSFLTRSMIFIKYARASVWLALREPYDVAFATTTPLTSGIPGIVARWLRRKPFVFEVRDLWPELPRAMGVITNPLVLLALSVLEWMAYRSAHRCIALSPGIAEGIARRGVDRALIRMIPNSCDFCFYPDTSRSASAATDTAAEQTGQSSGTNYPIVSRPIGVAATDLMAVYTGTFGVANGLDALLEAAKVLKARDRHDIKLVLVGDGKLKSELQHAAKLDGLDNVIFLERMPKADLAAVLTSADLGIQCLRNIPAFYDGTSPNKFFDYIAAGLPVLNNYPGWLAQMITSENMGFTVTPDNPEVFADALQQAADNRVELQAMGRRAREFAMREFDIDYHAIQWVHWVTGE